MLAKDEATPAAGPVTGEQHAGDRPFRRRLAVPERRVTGAARGRAAARRRRQARGLHRRSPRSCPYLHSAPDILRFRMLMIAAG